jgi:glutamyl-tRNA synthetase
MVMKDKEMILKYALQNAVFYKGKANPGAVLGKVLSQSPDLRGRVVEVRKDVERIVKEVNVQSFEEQKKHLEKLAPEMMEREKKEQEELPDLPNAEHGKVVTRFAPSPTGPLNLGQFFRAVMISYAYAKKYGGKFILRIEDTDAKKIEKEFYDWMKEDLRHCGISWDEFYMQSDRIETYYKYAEELVKKGHAYVCTCQCDDFKACKLDMKECPCRLLPSHDHLARWKDMLSGKYDDGEAVLRLKLDMCCPNPVMRDPPIFRVSKTPHPLKGEKYAAWPLYNLSCVIDDHLLGITHVFRGKEHEHNTTVQKTIANFLGWGFPTVVNFGMIRYPEEKLHTRDIKEWIKEGKISGWDDPRVPTIRAVLRRGFQPEALQQYGIALSLTKTDVTLDWGKLETLNRRIIDPKAGRYMVVTDPVKISVESHNAKKEVFEPLHPEFPEMGKKKVPVDPSKIYVSGEDYEKLKNGIIRLKGLFNVCLGKTCKYIGDDVVREMPKIQWVSEPHVKVNIVMRESTVSGIGEPELAKVKDGGIIQMERIGFGRIDSKTKDSVTVYFAHK